MTPSDLAPYLPIDRRHSLLTGTALPDRTRGSALFADVSGFTPLAAALAAALGPQRAAEELTRQLNRVYTALIGEVHCYRGSVIGFAGDAITCWFDDEDRASGNVPDPSAIHLPPSALRAATCALALQAAMVPLAQTQVLPGVTAALAVKVGVACGPARRFCVGDPEIQRIDVLAGDTLQRMARAEGQARRGEVLLDAAAAVQLGACLAVNEWRVHPGTGQRLAVVSHLAVPAAPGPWPAVPTGGLSESQLRPWVLPAVLARLQAGVGGSAFLAELRPAVSLFVRFGGIDYDGDDAAGEKLDAYVRWVQRVVQRYEGSLIQLTVGDKGSFLYVAFGAPVAHDDDPLRAVEAALELRSPPARLGFAPSPQVGLARGPARSGDYGSAARRTYGVIGDDAVLAARLMAAAPPGEVRAAHSIYTQARTRVAFEVLPPVRVKGRAELVRVYRPAAGRPEAVPSNVLVGRRAELAELESGLDALQTGQTRLLIVEGEAGIGKSRLVDELKRMARERGLAGLLGAGQSIEQRAPYRAWRDVFSSYFAIDGLVDAAERRQRVAAVLEQVAPGHAPRLPLLNDVLYLGLPDNETTRALGPQLRQQSLLVLLIDLLQAWARAQPLIVVLEDAHWLDDLSWQLAEQALRALALHALPLLLVIVNRPLEKGEEGGEGEDEGAAWHSLQRLQALDLCRTLRLGVLGPEEVRDLIAQRLGVAPPDLPAPVVELVQARSGGNPFFAEEMVFALRDHGIVEVRQVSERRQVPIISITGDLDRARRLPDTLHGLLLSRIDRLPPERQLVLKVAAVVGRTFACAPLQHALDTVLSTSPADLRAQLRALDASNFTFVEALEPDLTYTFKHIVTQEAAYQTLLFAQRRDLHGSVAAWYEAQPDASAYLPLLVHHFQQAEQAEKEGHYARLAGEQAARQFANAAALRYFGRALELAPETDPETRRALLLGREAVYDLLGERAAQAGDLEALLQLAAASGDVRMQALLALRQALYARATDDYPAALAAAGQALELARQCGDRLIETQALHTWGRVLGQQGEFEGSRERLEAALALARQGRYRQEEARSLYDLGTTLYDAADYAAARACLEQAQALYRELEDRPGLVRCALMFGALHDQLGEYVAAQSEYRRALDESRSIGWRYSEAFALSSLGNNAFDLGDYSAARDYHEQALGIGREIGHREGVALSLDTLGLIHTMRGDHPRALAFGEEALAIQRAIDDTYSLSYTLNHLGLARLASGEPELASAAFAEALDLRREMDLAGAVDDLAGLARAALAQGGLSRAQEYVMEVLAWLADRSTEGVEFPVLVYLTCYRVLRATGDEALAHDALAAGCRLLQERAAAIQDAALRAQFLENVPFNRDLLTAASEAGPGARVSGSPAAGRT